MFKHFILSRICCSNVKVCASPQTSVTFNEYEQSNEYEQRERNDESGIARRRESCALYVKVFDLCSSRIDCANRSSPRTISGIRTVPGLQPLLSELRQRTRGAPRRLHPA